MNTDLRLPPFRLMHAAYVTGDLEGGKRKLASLFGIREVRVYDQIAIEVSGGVAMINFALGEADGTPLEVIQPVGGEDSVYRQAVPADLDDISLHHFASRVVDKTEWNMVLDAIKQHGFDVPVRGGTDDYKYIYLDTRTRLGHMLEYIWYCNPEAEFAGRELGRTESIGERA